MNRVTRNEIKKKNTWKSKQSRTSWLKKERLKETNQDWFFFKVTHGIVNGQCFL